MAARWFAGGLLAAVAVQVDASKGKQVPLNKACPNYAIYATHPQ